MHRARPFLILLALAGLLLGLFPGTLGAQEITESTQLPTDTVVVRLYYGTRDRLNAVAGELDIWEVHHDQGYAVVAVTPAEYAWLQGLGYPMTIDTAKTALLYPEAPLDPRYYYYDDYYSNSYGRYWVTFLQDVNTNYPDITELIDIGDAWGGLHGLHARDIWVLRVSNEDPAYGPIADKPPFMIAPQAHAREVTTPEMAIRYIKYLTSGYKGLGGYGIDPDVTWMVDWHAIYILIGMNPDGHWKNEQDIANNWRKNIDNDDGCPTGRYGTDLNRNFAFKWGCCNGSSGNCSSDTYRGPSRASEPEVAALQAYFGTVFQDWNGDNGDDEIPSAAPDTTIGIWLSIHTYSDLVLWPWGFQPADAPNGDQLQKIGRKLAYYLELNGANYTPQQSYDLYVTDGSSDDWTYGKYGIPSYTFEMGPQYGGCSGFFPSFDCQEGENGAARNFWAEFRPTAIYMTKIARMPYREGYGPDASDLVVTPASVPRGTPISLSALIQDHRSNGDSPTNIAGAEYFIDNPGLNGNSDGSGTPMSAQDGAWGGSSETAIATIDTSGLSAGRHYVLVHGYGTNNYWGPLTAVFFTVEGECLPVSNAAFTWTPITPTVGQAVAFSGSAQGDAPISFAWDFGDGTTGSGPNPTHAYDTPGTFTVVMTATNCGGDGVESVSHPITVVQPCAPVHDPAFTWSPITPTVGESVSFSGSAQGDGPIDYEWDFGDGASGSGVTPTHAYAAAGNYTVVMTASNCATATAQLSHVLTVAAPAIAVSTVPTMTVYPGDAGLGTLAITNSGNYTLNWTLSEVAPVDWLDETPTDGAVPPGGHVLVTLLYSAPVTPTTYGAVLRIASNDPLSPTVDVDVVLVVQPPPCDPVHDAAFTWNPVVPYVGETVTFTGTAGGDAPITYTWKLDAGSWKEGRIVTYTYDLTGTYNVLMTATNCHTHTAVVEHPVQVIAPGACVPAYDANFTFAPANPLVHRPVLFTATVSGDAPFTYTWSFGDGTYGGGQTAAHAYGLPGPYTVVLTATNCGGAGRSVASRIVTVAYQIYLPLVYRQH